MTDDLRTLPELANRAVGGAVVWCNDDFYADVDNLLVPTPAVHDPLAYRARGKVYDGWETRRRREPGVDSAIVRLACPAVVRGVDVDTSWFRGNFPPRASVDATAALGYPRPDALLAADWFPLVRPSALVGDASNLLEAEGPDRLATHVRLTLHPDGGVARLRVFGQAVPDPRWLGGRVDLAATLHGGRVVACSNMFYSSPGNVLAPGRARVMSDGWETSRRRDDGNDWLVVELGAAGRLHDVVIDTTRFVGNAPGWAALHDADTGAQLLPRTALLPDTEHRFRLRGAAPVRRVRLDVYPDGGISRLRVHGEVEAAARAGITQRWLDLLGPAGAAQVDIAELFA